MRIFIYARKSVYTGKGESIDNQFELCIQHMHGVLGPDIHDAEFARYFDEGFSGKNLERPSFQRMISDIRVKKPDYLVVYRLDRLSRSVADFAALLQDLTQRGISFICVKEGFDTSNAAGKAFLYLAAVFAEMERDTIAERVRDNMMLLARTGRWLGGPPPTGFLSEKAEEIYIDGKVKTSSRLKIQHAEMKAVRLIFGKFLEIKSLAGVQKHLMRNGCQSREGKGYSRFVIKGILQNPVYCAADDDALAYFRLCGSDVCFDESTCNPKAGLLSYNKRDYKLKGSPRLSKGQWIIAVGKHPAIMTGRQWVAIQQTLDNAALDVPPKPRNDYSLLSGLLICEKCGSRMFSKPRSGSARADKTNFDYICGLKMNGGTVICGCRNLPGQMTDDAVCAELGGYAERGPLLCEHLEKLRHNLKQQAPVNPIVEFDARIKRANDEMNSLVSAISQGVSPALLEQVNARAAILKDEIERLVLERRRCQSSLEKADSRELQLELTVRSLATLKDRFDGLSLPEKRTILRLLVSKIVWDGERLHIFPSGG